MDNNFMSVVKAYNKMLQKHNKTIEPQPNPFKQLSESDRQALIETPDVQFLSEGLDNVLGHWMEKYKNFNNQYPATAEYFAKIESLYGKLIETISSYYGALIIELDREEKNQVSEKNNNLYSEYVNLKESK